MLRNFIIYGMVLLSAIIGLTSFMWLCRLVSFWLRFGLPVPEWRALYYIQLMGSSACVMIAAVTILLFSSYASSDT